jgi:hypothetical protein
VVNETVSDTLSLAEDTLLLEAQPGGNGSTALVVNTGLNLNPIQLPGPKCVVSERADRLGNSATTLRGLSDPIADARRTILPVNSVKAKDADDATIVDDRRLEALVICCG